MNQVEDEPQTKDEPVETIHLYVVREGQERSSIAPVIIAILALALLVSIGIMTPYTQPQEKAFIRTPAILSRLKTFTTSVAVIPTGVKTYPATTAHGTLTITNGSILSQELPKGMIFTGSDGVEVVIDAAVFVPPGSAAGYGVAYVSAHVARSGKSGDIQTLDIDSVEGASIYIRNLQPFTGGQDGYTVKSITSQDRENALSQARAILLPQTFSGLLQSPCKETFTGSQTLHVTWICQFVSYVVPVLPGMKVLHAEVAGKIIVLEVVFVARTCRLDTK